MAKARWRAAFDDVSEGLRRWDLWGTMGWYDVRQHYRRSLLGPLWLTLSMATLVGALGFLYGGLFGYSLAEYLPYLALGMIFWAFISNFMLAGCTVFSADAPSILQVNAPLSIYVFRLFWRNLITLAHNFVVYIVVALIFGIWPGATGLLLIPALAIVCVVGISASFLLGVLSARFRDIPPIVASLVQIMFFLSPILWKADQVPAREIVVGANPLYHLLTILRAPLLGEVPPAISWIFALGLAAAAVLLAGLFFARFRSRIAYWV